MNDGVESGQILTCDRFTLELPPYLEGFHLRYMFYINILQPWQLLRIEELLKNLRAQASPRPIVSEYVGPNQQYFEKLTR